MHYTRQLRHPSPIVVFLCLALGLAADLPGHAAPAQVGNLLQRHGSVQVSRADAAPLALFEGNPLYAEDKLSTAASARASVLFHEGSQFLMDEQTTVELAPPSSHALFKLLSGEVFARMRPGAAAVTDSAIAAVRGTEFGLAVDPDGTSHVQVVEGVVSFYNQYGGVQVPAGEQSDAVPGHAPTTPVAITNGSLLIELPKDLALSYVPREEAPAPPGAPSDPNVARGDTLLAQDRLDDAAAAYDLAGNTGPALVGKAWVALRSGDPAIAQADAQQALAATPPAGPEAQLLIGLALMRQPGQADAARTAFSAVQGMPYSAQAQSWRGMLELQEGDTASALADTKAAVAALPNSALAHGNLALVYFLDDQPNASVREARRAVALDPNSVTAQIALGQALLEQGNADGAAVAGAKAVALAPDMPEAYYLEGVADAARNDLGHAERELRDSVKVAPDFLPAVAALARVEEKRGHGSEAVTSLQEALKTHPDSPDLHAALGLILYNQRHYGAATVQYELAAKERPESGVIHAEFARVLLDENRLNEAIHQAQLAVQLDPGVAQYHALLGLCYSYGVDDSFTGPNSQSEDEYREAIALDPTNGLSRFELGKEIYEGTSSESQITGVEPVQLSGISAGSTLFAEPERPKNGALVLNSITQAALFDPAVSDQILQGGVSTELSPSADKYQQHAFTGDNRENLFDGLFHSYVEYDWSEDRRSGENSSDRQSNVLGYATITPTPDTTVVGTVVEQGSKQEFPPYASTNRFQPGLISRAYQKSIGDLGSIDARERLFGSSYVWAGVGGLFTRDDFVRPTSGYANVTSDSRNVAPEIRIDTPLSDTTLGAAPTLTLGASQSPQHVYAVSGVLAGRSTNPLLTYISPVDQTTNLYAQVAQHVSNRFEYAILARQEKLQQSLSIDGASEPSNGEETIWLPRILLTVLPNRQTTIRLFVAREREDTTVLTFEPTETLLALEPDVLPFGDFSQSNIYELDLERILHQGESLKLFGFSALSNDLVVGEADTVQPIPITLLASQVEREGVGLRYERAITRTLFGKVMLVAAHTYVDEAATQTQIDATGAQGTVNLGEMPYQINRRAELDLDYVDRTGDKAELQVRHQDPVIGTKVVTVGFTPTQVLYDYPTENYVDIRLAKEASVSDEIYVQLINALNAGSVQFNNVDVGGREVDFGVTVRF